MEANKRQLKRQERDEALKKQCQEHAKRKQQWLLESVSVDIKSWRDISFKLTDATRKVTITKKGWVPFFATDIIETLSSNPFIKGVTDVSFIGVSLNVDLLTQVLSFGMEDTVCTSNLKSLKIEGGTGLFSIGPEPLTKNTLPNLKELIIQPGIKSGENQEGLVTMLDFLNDNKSLRTLKCFHYGWYCNKETMFHWNDNKNQWYCNSHKKEQDVILNNIVNELAKRGWEDTKKHIWEEVHTDADGVVAPPVEVMDATIRPKLWSRILEKTMKERFIFDSTEEKSGRVPDARLLFDMLRNCVLPDLP